MSDIGGKKFDFGKLRYDLLPSRPVADTVAVLTFGATKYGDRNWENGIVYSRCYAAALRHILAWWEGENLDTETGISHLAHAVCELMFLQEFEKTAKAKELDDRPITRSKISKNRKKALNSTNSVVQELAFMGKNCQNCRNTLAAGLPESPCEFCGHELKHWEPSK